MDITNKRLQHFNSFFERTFSESALSRPETASSEEVRYLLKNSLKSAWNNVKYGWSLRSPASFVYESPILLLGKLYHPKKLAYMTNEPKICGSSFEDFLNDYRSRIWLTYRSGFAVFPGTNVNTDCGWGCMLRSTQMMIAQTLITLHLSRDWKWIPNEKMHEKTHREIVGLFGDSLNAPLSLHSMLSSASKDAHNFVGKWYSPSEAAILIKDAVLASRHPLLQSISIHVITDYCLSKSDVLKVSNNWSRSVLLIICIRLGAEKVNRCYHHHLKTLMATANCTGIVGGRPKHSVYFVGFYHKYLLYLDSHLVQKSTYLSGNSYFPLKSYHCSIPFALPLANLDPSCSIGFLVQSNNDFTKLIHDLDRAGILELEDDKRKVIVKKDALFTVVEQQPCRFEGSEDAKNVEKVAQARKLGFELL